MPEVDEIGGLVASKKLTDQDFYLYVGRQAIKAVKKIKPKIWNTLRTNSTG